jgi:hypothetical protein
MTGERDRPMDEEDRFSHMVREVFWWRWKRDADEDDLEDAAQLLAIIRWAADGACFLGESPADAMSRFMIVKAIAEVTGP